MALTWLAWTVGGVWVGGAVLLVLVGACIELFGHPRRPLREGLVSLLRLLPIVVPLSLGWPLFLVLVVRETNRDLALEQACYGPGPQPPPRPLTEKDWYGGRDAAVLLAWLGSAVSERKRRLFACACCRHVWDRLRDPRSRRAVELAEQLADAAVEPQETLEAARDAAQAASTLVYGGNLETGAAARACQDCLSGDAPLAAVRTALSDYRRRRHERRAQCELLREIVGDPFRPLRPRPFPPEVVELARVCEGGDTSLYALLADALDDLGEAAAAAHCRRGGHVKGCHVLDWVLGRA